MAAGNTEVARSQWKGAAILVGMVATTLGLGLWAWSEVRGPSAEELRPKDIVVRSLERGASADKAWWVANKDEMATMRRDLEELRKQQGAGGVNASQLQTQLEALKAENSSLKEEVAKAVNTYGDLVNRQTAEIQDLKKANEELAGVAVTKPGQSVGGKGVQSPRSPGYGQMGPEEDFVSGDSRRARALALASGVRNTDGAAEARKQSGTSVRGSKAVIRPVNLSSPGGTAARLHDPKEYVPVGAYAPVRIIMGVDASAGVSDQADPRPMLGRVVGPARSVMDDGKVITTQLTGCLITFEGRADLASERVYGRSLKMSCPAPGGMVREVRVNGQLADRGTVGVRGPVVERTGDLVQNATVAGFAGGLGSSAATALSPNLGGITLNGSNPSAGKKMQDSLLGGLGGGVREAGETLSDYFVRRLEQIQPVISAPTGAEVEIVFLQGFYLDGRPTDEAADQQRDIDASLDRVANVTSGLANNLATNVPAAVRDTVQKQIKGIQ